MSIGFPDGQRITQWLGAPIVQGTARAIGNVLVTDGPFNLASWASVIVAIKPTGGSVTATVRQQINGGPAALQLPTTFVVPVGQTVFESVVLFADTVFLDLTGSAAGVTVDYAVYPSNTTTNAQVLANATINVQKNEVLVASEGTLDLVDNGAEQWIVTDDPSNARLKISRQRTITGDVQSGGVINAGSGFTVNKTGVGVYVINFTTSFLSPAEVLVTAKGAAFVAQVASGIGSCTLNFFNNALAAADSAFYFHAEGIV